MDRSQLFGITESSEVAFNLDIFERLYDGNIIITKRLTNKLIDKLIEYKEHIILHLTVTGHGGSKLEPFVPVVDTTHKKLGLLLDRGFPVEQCVLRIDPIIPTDEGIVKACNVIELFKGYGIKRVRISILDMYPHVKERFIESGIELPFDTFHAPLSLREDIVRKIKELGDEYGFEVETCGEPGIDSIPCLSQKDVDILGLTDKITLVGSAEQRSNCKCPQNKQELIQNKEYKAKRCSSACLYCFWK